MPRDRSGRNIQPWLAMVRHSTRQKTAGVAAIAGILSHRLQWQSLSRRREDWTHTPIPRTPLPSQIGRALPAGIHLVKGFDGRLRGSCLLARVGIE